MRVRVCVRASARPIMWMDGAKNNVGIKAEAFVVLLTCMRGLQASGEGLDAWS